MKSATGLFAILTLLAAAAIAGPLHRSQALTTRNLIPEHITWQSNVNRTQDPMVPNTGAVKACQRTTYYSGTPATGIQRSDCQELANQTRSSPGYVSGSPYLTTPLCFEFRLTLLGLEWEMWWWDNTSGSKTLTSYGTCNVGVSRSDGKASDRENASDIAM